MRFYKRYFVERFTFKWINFLSENMMKKMLLVSIGLIAMATLSGCVVGPARHHSVGVDVGVGVSPVYVGSTYREPVYYRPPVVQRVWIKQPRRDVHWGHNNRGHRGDWGRGRGNSRGHR